MKQDELDAEEETLKSKQYEREREEYISKILGCSKDHGKEIDLYNKSYEEKIHRIKTLVEEAEKSEDDFQKSAYYFAQALLVFYYTIPENEAEESEVS